MADASEQAKANSRLQCTPSGVLNFRPNLSGIDSQRVLAVLEKAVERLELLRVMNYETATDAATIGALNAAATIAATSAAASGVAGGPANAAAAAAIAETLLKRTNGGATVGGGAGGTMGGTSGGGAGGGTGRGVGDILEEQRALEERYESLLKATQRDAQNPRDPKMDAACYSHVRDEEHEALKAELRSVSVQLKDQSRLLCRQLRENPNDANNWKKIVTERDELIKMLLAGITELQTTAQMSADAAVHSGGPSSSAAGGGGRGGGGGGGGISASYESFARKILDERSASAWAEALVKKEKETNQSVKQLQNDVKLERALKEQELEQCDRQLAALKSQLRSLKKEMRLRADEMRAKTEAATEAQEGDALEQQRVLNNAIGSTLGAIDVEQTVHIEMTAHISKKKALLEDYIQKRNAAMSEKNEARDRMRSELQNDCNTRRADIERKESQREEGLEAKEIREREAEQRAQTKKDTEARANARYEAATKLQAALKAMITRANLVALKKKAAKKKKAVDPAAAPAAGAGGKQPGKR